MSARAIRRLREERQKKEEGGNDEESSSAEEEDAAISCPQVSSFAAMMDDSESDDDDDDSSSNSGEIEHPSSSIRIKEIYDAVVNDEDRADLNTIVSIGGGAQGLTGFPAETIPSKEVVEKQESSFSSVTKNTENILNEDKVVEQIDNKEEGKGKGEGEDEDDVDALIEEFREKDEIGGIAQSKGKREQERESSFFQEILASLDPRDLDVDYVMRTSLLGDNLEEPQAAATTRGRRNRQVFLFGAPRDGWLRPPHYVGGGIGMTTYDREEELSSHDIPWPYNINHNINHYYHEEDTLINEDNDNKNDTKEKHHFTTNSKDTQKQPQEDKQKWFRFVYSDNIHRDYDDFRRVQQSGDVNALVLFVAHHPYLTEALLQLAMMLYQINRGQEGLLFLRRCLWVYECSYLMNFTPTALGNDFLMDYHHMENSTYFLALFRLAQVSKMAGMPRASLAISRFLLSLDPLRDPTSILMALDHYALASNTTAHYQWLVNLVECKKIKIYYRDDIESMNYNDKNDKNIGYNDEQCRCDLLDLPNWSYSYALALFLLQQQRQNTESNNKNSKASKFLQLAMSRFPTVVDLLLQANDIDTTKGIRSFQRDWPSVIGYISRRSSVLDHLWSETADMDTVVRVATSEASELITRIFVKQNHKLWASNDILQWLFDNLRVLNHNNSDNDHFDFSHGLDDTKSSTSKTLLSPAIRRYGQSDPYDYESRFDLLPPEANPLDPGLLAHAMAVDPNRRRFLRGQQRGGRGFHDDMDAFQNEIIANQQQLMILGPPTNTIDPDWPILEIFWRSLLPWNRVDRVPRPRR